MVLINGSQILLPNDYQRNIDYIQCKEDFVGKGVSSQFSKIFLKENTIALQKNEMTLKRQPTFC